jgi:phytoene synthase
MLPSSLETRFATALDDQACREAIRTGSRSFYTASWLLPERVRQPAYGLYAFCRLSDDAVDLGECGDDELARLRIRLDRVYAGRPVDHPADRAMADIVRAYHIPREAPEALLEGLAWDCEGRRFETIEDLHAYAARVAATVGVMMTLLMGVREPAALARACDLGVAMQLTNIARDVGEDARNGRCYLPLRWLEEAGVNVEAFVRDPTPSPAVASVVARLLAEADRLYQRAREGVARLPFACRPAILAAAAIYGEIGREVEGRGYDSINGRARVTGSRKLSLLLRSCLQASVLATGDTPPPLEATAFLVDAVHPLRATARERYSVSAHALRVLAIFERLERAEQFGVDA